MRDRSTDRDDLARILWAFEANQIFPIKRGATAPQIDAVMRQRADYILTALEVGDCA